MMFDFRLAKMLNYFEFENGNKQIKLSSLLRRRHFIKKIDYAKMGDTREAHFSGGT
jgi:hypothetical protein